MKKIFIFISTVIITVSMLCITVFGAGAESVDFGKYAAMSHMNFYKLTPGDNGDYIRWTTVDSENNIYETGVQATDYGAGTVTYDRFYFYLKLKAPSIGANYTFSDIGSVTCPFYSGNYITARIRFKMSGVHDDTLYPIICMRTSSSQSVFNWGTMPTVGELKKIGDNDTITEYEAVINYKNTGSTIDNFSCQFMFCFLNSKKTVLYDKIVVYEPRIYDYYFGNGSEPDAPIYKDFSQSVGNDVNDLKNKEDSLMNDTEQGRENTISLFQNFASTLSMFTVPLLAIKGLFDYLIADTVFEGILLISLTLGLLAFVFNIFPSIQARQNRKRIAEARRNKNANQNKGGS